jgi:hypothetical protein
MIGNYHLVIAMEIHFGWKLYQMDIKSAFLNSDFNEVASKEHLVCKLVKAIYRLK